MQETKSQAKSNRCRKNNGFEKPRMNSNVRNDKETKTNDDNNNNINDTDDSNGELLKCTRKIQSDGTIVYDFSNENVEIRAVRCYKRDDINHRDVPSISYNDVYVDMG